VSVIALVGDDWTLSDICDAFPAERLSGLDLRLWEDLGWHEDAACAEIGTDMFFPEKGGATRPAKRICRSCGVRPECLAYALRNGERGIWGGTSEEEREHLRTEIAA
jgi:WhiB family transcriptional regulator, redox-sensing transcriptional regulator